MEIEIRKEEAGIRNCRPAEGGGERQRAAEEDDWRGMNATAWDANRGPFFPWGYSLLYIRAYACAQYVFYTSVFIANYTPERIRCLLIAECG